MAEELMRIAYHRSDNLVADSERIIETAHFALFFGNFQNFSLQKSTAARAVPFAFYSPDNAAESSCSAAERFVCSSIVLIPVMSWLE